MNKIIPVISLIISATAFALSICGVILMSIAISVPQIAFVSVPIVLTVAGLSATLVMLNAFFYKTLLCKIALFVAVAALALSIVSIIIWLCM